MWALAPPIRAADLVRRGRRDRRGSWSGSRSRSPERRDRGAWFRAQVARWCQGGPAVTIEGGVEIEVRGARARRQCRSVSQPSSKVMQTLGSAGKAKSLGNVQAAKAGLFHPCRSGCGRRRAAEYSARSRARSGRACVPASSSSWYIRKTMRGCGMVIEWAHFHAQAPLKDSRLRSSGNIRTTTDFAIYLSAVDGLRCRSSMASRGSRRNGGPASKPEISGSFWLQRNGE